MASQVASQQKGPERRLSGGETEVVKTATAMSHRIIHQQVRIVRRCGGVESEILVLGQVVANLSPFETAPRVDNSVASSRLTPCRVGLA